MLYLHPTLKPYFSEAIPLFDQLMALQGEPFRHQDGRITKRVRIGDRYYFIKQHGGVGIKEILKNLLQLRLPVISAKNEWRAIAALKAAGVNVPVVVGYGERGMNPATCQSFILMEELAPVVSLEEFCQHWRNKPPSFALKRQLIAEIARIARLMHQEGINHRDFYLCHFLLDPSFTLYLIDLHRAQMRSSTPLRWIIKDLAALYFSAKEIPLTERDFFRFMRYYRKKSLREILNTETDFWQKVKNRGNAYRDHTQ